MPAISLRIILSRNDTQGLWLNSTYHSILATNSLFIITIVHHSSAAAVYQLYLFYGR